MAGFSRVLVSWVIFSSLATERSSLLMILPLRDFGDNLPKTRSGKIMRRLLRAVANDEKITQDTSTLENPAILEQLAEKN